MTFAAPFPWFGGKSQVAHVVWDRLGRNINSYIEPFFGSGAVLLGRPGWSPEKPWTETVNDLDGFVSNAWRAIRAAPEETADFADWPVNEVDLTARHAWLVGRRDALRDRLMGDPEWCDPKIAGWWLWGMACWIGGGFCSGAGPWSQQNLGTEAEPDWQLVHLSGAGRGVQRQLVHLGDAGRGVNAGRGEDGIHEWFAALSSRLSRVRVCCGDWSRVVTDAAMMLRPGDTTPRATAVFLDPPYSSDAGRDMDVYAEDSGQVALDVRKWCVENGPRPELRIALCGYRGEGHEILEGLGWTCHEWVAHGGYANQGNGIGQENRKREAIWFSPHCLAARQRRLA